MREHVERGGTFYQKRYFAVVYVIVVVVVVVVVLVALQARSLLRKLTENKRLSFFIAKLINHHQK